MIYIVFGMHILFFMLNLAFVQNLVISLLSEKNYKS